MTPDFRIDYDTARRRLEARWLEQYALGHSFAMPIELYVKRNIDQVMRFGLLAKYDDAPRPSSPALLSLRLLH
jgi:hypothetical protein